MFSIAYGEGRKRCIGEKVWCVREDSIEGMADATRTCIGGK